MHDLQYPIGQYAPGLPPDRIKRSALVDDMSLAPRDLREAVAELSEAQLDTTYRPDGWTIRQVVHHLADAQMNWYVRTKLALTEDEPIVKPYDEVRWAETLDARSGPIEPSLILLDGLYARWTALWRSLTEDQWKRRMRHPERGIFVLDETLPMHVWHGRHHTAQIAALRERNQW
jgi:uncharacterized damage-inducible protein DinB